MDIAIVYYSYSGNTHKAVEIIEQILSENNFVKRLRIEAPKESNNFFIQALRALTRKKIEIASLETDLSPYDLIIFATPVWAREIVPAMRSYLDKASGLLHGKQVGIFVTYGSGFGKENCIDSLKLALENKGAKCIGQFSISQFKVGDKQLIENLLKENMRL
jgi:flavodoxin